MHQILLISFQLCVRCWRCDCFRRRSSHVVLHCVYHRGHCVYLGLFWLLRSNEGDTMEVDFVWRSRDPHFPDRSSCDRHRFWLQRQNRDVYEGKNEGEFPRKKERYVSNVANVVLKPIFYIRYICCNIKQQQLNETAFSSHNLYAVPQISIPYLDKMSQKCKSN